jgi:Cd2+/Zn2+-exporting ATPase
MNEVDEMDNGCGCGCGCDEVKEAVRDYDGCGCGCGCDGGDEKEESESGARAIVRLAVGAAVFATAFVIDRMYTSVTTMYLAITMFAIAYAILGLDVVLRAVRNIARGRLFDENFLMGVATIGAFAIGEYAEGAAVMLFYQIGEFFQSAAVRKSKKSIADLMDIRPDFADVRVGGETTRKNPADVAVGDVIVVKPGGRIPLDGIIKEGEGMVDTKALTGESVPRSVTPGDTALSGCVNLNSLLAIEVTKPYGESTVAKIIDLVENASSRKAPTENFITTFSRYYTPAVVGFAALLAVVPPLLGLGVWSEWIRRGLVFLVISCPCALVISIPLGFFGGIGGASRKGILVKGGNFLEALNALDIVVFDKTGTLTKGVFAVTGTYPAAGHTGQDLLGFAAQAEAFSNHPIALSIRDAYGKPVEENALSGYAETAGKGVAVVAGGKRITAGNERLMSGVAGFEPNSAIGTKVYVAVDGVYAGCVVISDEAKPDSKAALAGLKKLGIRKTVMLTGDNKAIGEAMASELGLDEVLSELLPGDKVGKLEDINDQTRAKGKLAYVGDGINDAPVLARADVGIAMGGLGSDAAIEAADVVLMTDEPSKLLDALSVARFTKRVVMQNIAFALGVKCAFLALGAFGVATMWEAVFADVGVALLAILNATRVLRK